MTAALPRVPKIVAIGEILWDLFPDGPRFGGAPANFICHAAGLGANAHMIGAVGDDDLGQQTWGEFSQRGVQTQGVATLSGRPTGTVPVTLDAAGKPTFEIIRDVAWDDLSWSETWHEILTDVDVLCFGTLGQRSESARQAIRQAIAVARAPLTLLDINLRPPFGGDDIIRDALPLATILKLNDDELPVLARILSLTGSIQQQLEQLVTRYKYRLIALTRGGQGSLLLSETGACSDHAGLPVTIRDTVGAGDAFTAALALGLCRGWPLGAINEHANRVAAYVCSQPGATPLLPQTLRQFSP